MRTDAAAGAGERMEAGRRRAPSKRTRAVTPVDLAAEPTWVERLSYPLNAVAGPTRQVWLATLGGAALTVQGAAAAWTRLVAEGSVVEQAIRERAQLVQRFGRFTGPARSRA